MLQEHLQVVEKLRDNFLQQRSKQEVMVDNWAATVKRVSPSLLEGIELPTELNLRGLIPELYAEHPNIEVYNQQFNCTVELITAVNKRIQAYNAEVEKIQSTFYTSRARQEVEVNTWAEKITKVDKAILGDLVLPENITLSTLIPELYESTQRKEVYLEQLRKAQALFDSVNELANKYNEEATACLSRYEEMN